ncbi:uncharacterized protein LOC143192338 isoform X2 [Rhynchophorus ferrugineus]|uniref:uncharacterized protein LOC143192338 isoform X2 n=1 Tax=Rhynchophorus ferrugineus TaxID=354439 RepID=UPI003FCCDF09
MAPDDSFTGRGGRGIGTGESSATHNCTDIAANDTEHHHQSRSIEDTIIPTQNSSGQQKRSFDIGNVTQVFKENFKSLNSKIFGKREGCTGCKSSDSPNVAVDPDQIVADIPKKSCCSNSSSKPPPEELEEVNDNFSPIKEKRTMRLIIGPGENTVFHNTANASSIRNFLNKTRDKEMLEQIQPQVLKEYIRAKREDNGRNAGNDSLNRTQLFFIGENNGTEIDRNNIKEMSQKCKERMRRVFFNNNKSQSGFIRLFDCLSVIKIAGKPKGPTKSIKLSAEVVPEISGHEKQIITKHSIIDITAIYPYNETKVKHLKDDKLMVPPESDNGVHEADDILEAKLKANQALRLFLMKLKLPEKIIEDDEENFVDGIGIFYYTIRTIKAIYYSDSFYLEMASYLLAVAAFLLLLLYLLLWLGRMNLIPSTIVTYRATRR